MARKIPLADCQPLPASMFGYLKPLEAKVLTALLRLGSRASEQGELVDLSGFPPTGYENDPARYGWQATGAEIHTLAFGPQPQMQRDAKGPRIRRARRILVDKGYLEAQTPPGRHSGTVYRPGPKIPEGTAIWVPKRIIDRELGWLASPHWLVFVYLYALQQREGRIVCRSQDIAEALDIGGRTVRDAYAMLTKAQLISREVRVANQHVLAPIKLTHRVRI